MKNLFFLLMISMPIAAHAGQSSITEAEGQACMGDDQTRRDTKNIALQDAKRLAMEYAGSYIESETVVENFQLKSDLVKAFKSSEVKVLEVLNETWSDSDCYSVTIKAEVIPSEKIMKSVDDSQIMADPRLPLRVKLTTSKEAYVENEQLKVYIQGNKPFYARLIYVDASGNNIQVLPNQHRRDNYFAGASILEIPSAQDKFLLPIGAPFGEEKLVLYASTTPLGQVETTELNADVFLVQDNASEIARRTRGITLTSKSSPIASGPEGRAAPAKVSNEVGEFFEAEVSIVTSPAS